MLPKLRRYPAGEEEGGLGRARCRSRRVRFCSALGNVVWPKLLNENRGKDLQPLPLTIIFPQMAKS